MKIIGGHDYYDSAQAYGHDPKVVFIRDAKEVEKVFKRPNAGFYFVTREKAKAKSPTYWHRFKEIKDRNGHWSFSVVRIVFCGKMHVGIRCEYNRLWSTLPDKPPQVFWDEDDFNEWLSPHDAVLVKEDRNWIDKQENVLFTSYNLVETEYHYVIDNRISIAVHQGDDKWVLNGSNLKELQFYRVFDAVTAFQELDMWMSGALGLPGAPMVEIDDKYRMEKHGMDKWSFRKKVR